MSLARIPILRHGLTVWDKSLISETEVQSRFQRVRKLMQARQLDALIVYSDMSRSGDVAYLTNFHSFDARMPGVVLVTRDNVDAVFKVTSRDLTYVSKYVWVNAQSVDFLSGNLAEKLGEIATTRGLNGKLRVGLVGATFAPTNLVRGIETLFPDGTVESADALLESLRRDKSAAERMVLRLAAAKCETVLAELGAAATAGMTEAELAAHADYLARRAGAQDAEVLFYATGQANGPWPRDHFPFRPAAERALPRDGAVGIYIAMQYHGYWVELSQSIFVGASRPAQVEAHQLALAAFDELLAGAVRPNRSADGDATTSWIHGTGLDRNEAPLLTAAGHSLVDGDMAAVHVAVRRGGDVTFFGRQAVVSQTSTPLVPPVRAALSANANA